MDVSVDVELLVVLCEGSGCRVYFPSRGGLSGVCCVCGCLVGLGGGVAVGHDRADVLRLIRPRGQWPKVDAPGSRVGWLEGEVDRLMVEVARLSALLLVVAGAGGGDLVCVVCGCVFVRRSHRGPVPRFCSAVCRQRAVRDRQLVREAGGVVEVADAASEVRVDVERLTVELAVEKAEHVETTRELNCRCVELVDDGAAVRALGDEVERLTARLAEARKATTVWAENAGKISVKLTQAEAREKSLRELVLEVVEAMPDWWDAGEAAVSYWTQRLNEVT